MAIEKTFRAETIEELTELLTMYYGKTQILAGGTDLGVALRQQRNRGEIWIDISSLKELQFIDFKPEEVILGAGTTFAQILKSEEIQRNYAGLWKACKSIGSPQIRNRGTIGGNICNASPAADAVPPLLALDAQVVLMGKNTLRTVNLRDFYLDKGRVDLKNHEFLYAIKFKAFRRKQGLGFEKIGFRRALAISKLSCSVYLELEKGEYIKDIRIATGALASYPKREMMLEQLLRNKYRSEALIEATGDEVADYISQRVQGIEYSEYKSGAVKGLFMRSLRAAWEEAENHDENQGQGQWTGALARGIGGTKTD